MAKPQQLRGNVPKNLRNGFAHGQLSCSCRRTCPNSGRPRWVPAELSALSTTRPTVLNVRIDDGEVGEARAKQWLQLAEFHVQCDDFLAPRADIDAT